ncbi:MAG: glycogen phosphorylase [Thermoproteota archaeon]|nr:glycogen phosphorylase [Thermoproteota archaeon]
MSTIIRCPICGTPIHPDKMEYDHVCIEYGNRRFCFCSESCRKSFLEGPRIAYFSMEIAVANEIPTYSGGLGILAGDVVRSSADLRLRLIALTLVSRKGYLKQRITSKGEQLEYPDEWNPEKSLTLMPKNVKVRIEGRDVIIQAWLYEHQSFTGGLVPVLFLDTDVEGNVTEDRRITDYLYGGDDEYRLKQEIILGIGGIRILKELFFNVRKYHMNEGHSSLLTLQLLRDNDMDNERVRNLCVFTTHTPAEAAFDKFSYSTFQRIYSEDFPLDILKKYASADALDMTELGSNLSKYLNGVSEAHREYSMDHFPGHYIRAITNGVHSYTWTSTPFRELFDRYIPGWANEPIMLGRASQIPNNEIWDAHNKAKMSLFEFVKNKTYFEMDMKALTIGFARRSTAYKRGSLIFNSLERLRRIDSIGKLQLIFAGKAHTKDEDGKRIIKEIHQYMAELGDDVKTVYLENYDMDTAAKLTSGVDIWLNTPLPPFEASGTSGMKAAHNGVINFSVLDGWWVEGCIEGVTGWAIGAPSNMPITPAERRKRELEDIYNKLEYLIIPMFYYKRDDWINIMKNSIGKVAYYFQAQWMMRRYITEAYLL